MTPGLERMRAAGRSACPEDLVGRRDLYSEADGDEMKMQQADKIAGFVGAAGDEFVRCHDLAIQAWGELAQADSSGLTAFAYLYRRFGPTFWGSDPYKDIAEYVLTTSRPDVCLTIHVSGSALEYSVGYLASPKYRKQFWRPIREWWRRRERWWWKTKHPEIRTKAQFAAMTWARRCGLGKEYFRAQNDPAIMREARKAIGPIPRRQALAAPISRLICTALLGAMRELLRPVYVRDIPINLFGRCEDSANPAEPSRWAGCGNSRAHLERMLKE